MDSRNCPKLRVLILGQQKSFDRVLAANIECWGHEVTVLPSEVAMGGVSAWGSRGREATAVLPGGKRDSVNKASEVEGDVLLYDLDESSRISALMGGKDTPSLHVASSFVNDTVKSCEERWLWDTYSQVKVPLDMCGQEKQSYQQLARLTIALSSHSVSRATLEEIAAVALLQKPFEMGRLRHYLQVLRRLLLEREETQQPGDKIRILVVDADVSIANIIRKYLIFESRYEVAVAHNGLKALEQCLEWRPHCIVTDVILPWMNGYQVIRCLTAGSLHPIPAFVITSALPRLEMPVNRSYLQGKVVAYVDKPFSKDDLLTAIEQVCIESV